MKIKRGILPMALIGLLLVVGPLILPGSSRAAPGAIAEEEAIAIADLWMAMELNDARSGLSDQERVERLQALGQHTVSYFVSGGRLEASLPPGEQVLAYVIEYRPAGYVVVAATDRLQPIQAHAVESRFWWDEPGLDLVRGDVSHALERMWQNLPSEPHPAWATLRAKLSQGESLEEVHFPQTDEYVFWETAIWSQGWPYNEVVAAHNGNNSNVPTGCVATAMAIKFRFHEWPVTGNGTVSYDDVWGSVQFSHSVNFGAQTYNWANMPLSNLTESNLDVATLMYHCGVAIHMNYEVGASWGWPGESAVEVPFRYRATEYIYTPEEGGVAHVEPLRRSLVGGLVILVASDSHNMVAAGYRNELGVQEFWINHGHGGPSNGWQTLAFADVHNSWPYSSPVHYVYVDGAWSGIEQGWIQKPFNTFGEGLSSVPNGGHLWLKEGNYTVPATLTKPMTIHSYEGPAVLSP